MRRFTAFLIAALTCFAGLVPDAQAAYQPPPDLVTVATLPAVPGFVFDYRGKTWKTGADGSVQVPRSKSGEDTSLKVRTPKLPRPQGVEARFDRWYGMSRLQQRGGRTVATMQFHYPVELLFRNLEGEPVPRTELGAISLKSSTGFAVEMPTDSGKALLQGSRVVPDNNGLQVKDMYFTVQSVDVQGNNVVNRSQTKFFPAQDHVVAVPLLFFDATVRARDAFFGFGLGGTLHLTYPNGRGTSLPLGENGRVDLPGLARGQYLLAVQGPGLRLSQPVAMSRKQDVDLKVFTWLDLAVTAVVLLGVAFGLLWWGHVVHRRRRTPSSDRVPAVQARPVPHLHRPHPSTIPVVTRSLHRPLHETIDRR